MSLWSRLSNVLRSDRLNRDIDEELRSHIDEAVEQGRDPAEARRAFGSRLSMREASRDVRLLPWLDSLRADAIFGWRQLVKRKVSSAVAILSLALAIGACTSAFRLIDALLLRPLPIAHSDRLYGLLRQGVNVDGSVGTADYWAYPALVRMREAVKDQAELLSISVATQTDLTYGSDDETEKASVQFVSGWMFPTFGLQPALGRLLTENDDLKPMGHPVAVISYDYWTHRFGQDPKVIGRTFRLYNNLYQIVGVGPEEFTGTEPGTVTGIFLPTMMSALAVRADTTWVSAMAMVRPGVANLDAALEPIRAKRDVTSRAFDEDRLKGSSLPAATLKSFLDLKLILQPAAAGLSGLQKEYRPALWSLAVLVALVLLIACANVANLMTAQAAARAREMALRVSIGAGRWRLVQLVMVESAWVAVLSAATGGVFAWWSAPFVVSMINLRDSPVRLLLPIDWRVLGFGMALTLLVTFLFGLIPALRASSVRPASALKGGADPHSRRRLMHGLIAAQVAFCFVVMFVAGMFAASFERLSNRPLGFSTDRLLTLETVTKQAQPAVVWDQVAQHLRETPGVESVALCGWPLLTVFRGWNGFISANGAQPGPELAFFLAVSPGWLDTMKIAFVDGRDFRPGDTSPGVAIVNQTFVRQYFNGETPMGKMFLKGTARYQVVGVVRDAPYRSIREPILPVAYVPMASVSNTGAPLSMAAATFLIRTSAAHPLTMASVLRQEVPRARGEFRVTNTGTQMDLVRAQTVRDRLLTMLALFFSGVALALAGVGLYGVLDYSVLQRRREIGIRMAIGARAGDIARRVTKEVFAMVMTGAVAGVVLGLVSVRYIETLLYHVKPTELNILALPALAVVVTATLASVSPVIRAVRIDPVTILRTE